MLGTMPMKDGQRISVLSAVSDTRLRTEMLSLIFARKCHSNGGSAGTRTR